MTKDLVNHTKIELQNFNIWNHLIITKMYLLVLIIKKYLQKNRKKYSKQKHNNLTKKNFKIITFMI